MKHYSYEEWQAYVQGEVTSSEQGEQMEDHLLQCETCLMQYMSAAEQNTLVAKRDREAEEQLIERVLSQLDDPVQPLRNMHKYTWANRLPLVHYAIAASLTILFVASGGFDLLVSHASDWTEAVEVQTHRSIDADKWIAWKNWLSDIVSPKGEMK